MDNLLQIMLESEIKNQKSKIYGCAKHWFYNCILISTCFLAVIVAVPSYSIEADIASMTEEELYEKCGSLYTEGKFPDAIQYIYKFLSLYPESNYTDEILFIQAFLRPDIDGAMESYRMVIENYPDSKWTARSHFQLAQCYYLQGEYDKALDHYGKILVSYTEDECYWPARYWRCKSLIAKGEYESAIAALRSLESIDLAEISKDMTLISLGNCYRGIEDYENAVSSYQDLIESVSNSHWISTAYLLLAKSYQDMGKFEEAKASYQKVVNAYPQSMEAQEAKETLASLALVETHPEEDLPKDQPDVPESVEKRIIEKVETKPTPSAPAEAYFSIQVGAFSSKRNADKLVEQLKKKGYSVYIAPPTPVGRPLYKVRIGKFKTRGASLLQAARKLREEEKLSIDIIHQPAIP